MRMSIDDRTVGSLQLLDLHSRAQHLVNSLLLDLPGGSLERQTPCSDWTLNGLLRHVVGQNVGLTQAARGGGQERSAWRPIVLGRDPARNVAESASDLVSAFADRGLDGTVWMPEISAAAPIPARVALLAHLVDTVVHGWDVAATLGRSYVVPADLLAVAAAVAKTVPDGANRNGLDPARAFGPALHIPVEGKLDILLAHLGRDPRWGRS